MQNVIYQLFYCSCILSGWESIAKEGLGASRSGNEFSAIHGELMIETTINREVKVRGGPMQGGYSTNIESMNKFVRTSHLMAKVGSALNEKITPGVNIGA